MKLEVLNSLLQFFSGEDIRCKTNLFYLVEQEIKEIRKKFQYFTSLLPDNSTCFAHSIKEKFEFSESYIKKMERQYPMLVSDMMKRDDFRFFWVTSQFSVCHNDLHKMLTINSILEENKKEILFQINF